VKGRLIMILERAAWAQLGDMGDVTVPRGRTTMGSINHVR